MIYGSVGCRCWDEQLDASWMFQREEGADKESDWFFFLVACSASGSGRQAGRQHAVWSCLRWIVDFRVQGE